MITFYKNEGFKFFPCDTEKHPQVKSWRATSEHLTPDQAERIMETGGFIGAWLPDNYIIIDIDMNHKDREGKPKPDGLKPFKALTEELGIQQDLLKETLVVKTGSGGFHLYFKLKEDMHYSEISQKKAAESVDIRTHSGYVIAAGTNGYTRIMDKEPMYLPDVLWNYLKEINDKKASSFKPTRILPTPLLKKILNRIDASNFDNNDSWQEFITSVIATAGNSEEVITLLEDWSKKDSRYSEDTTIRKRLETFEPEGGVTAGSFIHIIKGEGISKYLIDKVRIEIGAQFSYSQNFSEVFDIPFKVDFSSIHEFSEVMKAFYYSKHQAAGVTLFAKLTKENLLYSTDEKRFYHYNGNRWIESHGIMDMIFTVLLHAGQRFYSDVSKKKDNDADEAINSYISFIGSLTIISKFEGAIKQHPEIARDKVMWDGPELEATLTLNDSVMDFSNKEKVTFRKGTRAEHRRLYIDLLEKDFKEIGVPTKFKEFLKDVFPNDDTRKTATYALSTMLSGTGKFRKFQVWNGSGNNSKSSLMDIMKVVIGNRAISYEPNILLSSKLNSSLTPELAIFRGALAGFASETEESKRISQGAVKQLTGDETMTANPKYQGMIEFKTTFQLVLSTNYLPSFSAHDNAFVNRLLILPFYTCFYDTPEKKEGGKRNGSRYFKEAKDINILKAQIFKERAQILYYLAKRYGELEFSIPESQECIEAKAHYIDDNNDIVNLIHDALEFDITKDYFTPTKDLISYYNEEHNTRYSSKFIVARIKEVLPLVENYTRRINGKLTRGLKHIRLIYGAYPDGFSGNYTDEEIQEYMEEEEKAQFKEASF